MCSGKIEGLARRWPARRRAYPAGAPLLMSKAAGKPPGPAGPGPGAHGGGGLYGQGKDQPCIAARFPGCVGRGAAAPWEARIGVTLQAQKTAALYRLGPPGRRRCYASEISWWSWQLYRGARRPGAPSVEYRADTKRGNLVRNLRGTSSAAASKFCGVIDAGRPSAAARERSPPGDRARWTHARLMPGSTQSTAAVLPRVQGPQALVVFPPLLTSKAGRPPRRRSPEAGPPLAGRPQVAPTDGAPGRRAPQIGGSGESGRMISAPTGTTVTAPGRAGALSRTPRRPPRSWI